MILIGLGANLPSRFGGPAATLEAALAALAGPDIAVAARSRWYESAPIPVSDQPWYVNGAARLETALPPDRLLQRLHEIEAAFGRERSVPNAARPVDLDLLDYDGTIASGWPILPHPRLHERAFVLLPLLELAPSWRHPVTREAAALLLDRCRSGQEIRPLDFSG
jgi:2-amino-4-hydroxy-6-hydroxymethyldihydropteridine diphosphokinase